MGGGLGVSKEGEGARSTWAGATGLGNGLTKAQTTEEGEIGLAGGGPRVRGLARGEDAKKSGVEDGKLFEEN